MKMLMVVGARPQFIKAAVLNAEIARREEFTVILVHSGQHYDYEMSGAFFEELQLKSPDYNLDVGSGSHAYQTAEIMRRLEPVLLSEQPDWVVVFGDTNTTLAAALAAAKLCLPLAHVEAGLRSFNRTMPEEINRIVADHVADIHFAPHAAAAEQLAREGMRHGVEIVGDLMIDLALKTAAEMPAPTQARVLKGFGVSPATYGVATVHRPANTDNPAAFARIITGLRQLPFPIVFPVHPRAESIARAIQVGVAPDNIIKAAPIPYRDMIALQRHARMVVTDSGGMQKEAFVLGVPCVTLRRETEWPETLAAGWNVLAGDDPKVIAAQAQREPPLARGYVHDNANRCAVLIANALLRRAQRPQTVGNGRYGRTTAPPGIESVRVVNRGTNRATRLATTLAREDGEGT